MCNACARVRSLKERFEHAPIFFPGRAPRSRDKKEENVVIGLCGFTGPPDPEGVVEIAYSVAPSYLAKGCATEAVIALLAYANHSGLAGTNSRCVASAIAAADSWLCSHPIGSNVTAQ